MIRRPPRSTLDRSSAASDVYKRQDEQRPGSTLSIQAHDDNRWNDSHETGDETTEPRTEADVDEALHDNLTGKRASQRRVLARAEQRDGKQNSGGTRAEQGRQELVRVADVCHRFVLGAVEDRR